MPNHIRLHRRTELHNALSAPTLERCCYSTCVRAHVIVPVILLTFAPGVCGRQGDDLATQSESARQAMAAGEFGRAAGIYANLIKELPPNAGLLLNLGMALHYEGKYMEAAQQLKAALRLKPDLTPASFFLGVSYAKLHEPELALAPLRVAATADRRNKTFQLEFADALLATEQYEDAAQGFDQVLHLDAAEARGWQGLGLSYVGLSQGAFRILESPDPDNPYVLLLLADSYLTQERYRSAYKLYRTALARGIAVPGIHDALAEVYRKTQHPDWAATEEQREQDLSPPDCSAHPEGCAYMAGRQREAITSQRTTAEALYWKVRSYETLALAAFDKLREMPSTPQIHELMADAYRARGHNHEAVQELREALRLDPGNERYKALYATALWRDHDYASARPILEQLVRSDPNSADLKFELGDTLLQQDEPQRAVAVLLQAVQSNPRLLPAQAALAKAYMDLGQASDAIRHFQAALSADTDGSLHFQLVKAYERTGQLVLAKRTRDQFADITRHRHASEKDDDAEISAP